MATPKKRPEPTLAYETLTPEDAAKLLATTRINRPLMENGVQQWMRSIEAGLWGQSNDTICIDWDGHLINGQHRLTAQVRLGLTMRWPVQRGLDPASQGNMDIGKFRTFAQELHFLGYKNTNIISSITKGALMATKFGYTGQVTSASSPEMMQFFNEHRDILRSTELAVNFQRGSTHVTPSVIGTTHWYMAQHINQADADSFLYRLAGLVGEGDGSAVIALSKRFNNLKINKVVVSPRDQIAMLVRGWNREVLGVKTYKISVQTRAKEFKLPVPLPKRVYTTDEVKKLEDDTE